MTDLPDDLRRALDSAVGGVPAAELTRSVGRLIEAYRAGGVPAEPILRTPADVAGYAAYRMPATFAAARAALGRYATVDPAFQPRSQLDVGGGTGAAVWAAAATWPSLRSATVLEQAPHAIALGQRVAAAAAAPAVRDIAWQPTVVGDGGPLPDADLVTVSYLLGELAPARRDGLVRRLAGHRGVVALVEPGTPAGYECIVAVRDLFIELGRTVAAPCPHDRACPIERGRDWCHFAARVNRSGAHRQAKAATLGYEDEKFSYVVVTAAAPPKTAAPTRVANRILRHPRHGKGLVGLRLCTGAGGIADAVVAKRQGPLYRAARDARWGDGWPPPDGDARAR